MLDQSTFPQVQYHDWKTAVAKLLNTEDVESKLLFKSVEDLEINPLGLKSEKTVDLFTFPEKVTTFIPKIITDTNQIDVTQVHNAGASVIQEMTYALNHFYQKVQKQKSLVIHVACDSMYFVNIAKLRAMRFCFERLIEELQLNITFEIKAYNSLREQTLFDPWVNMLRSTVSSMAAIIGGANAISSYSYDQLYSLYSGEKCSELGHRQSQNILKILIDESHLDIVKDPMKGSYSIDNLTMQIIQKGWQSFLNSKENFSSEEKKFSHMVALTAQKRFELIRTRRQTITGINNFANPNETLESIYQHKFNFNIDESQIYPLRPVTYEFEKLRNQINGSKIKMQVLTFGPEDKLSARLNFSKNYFELLGIAITEQAYQNLNLSLEAFKKEKAEHLLLCALDEDYQNIEEIVKAFQNIGTKTIYLAGNPKGLDIEKLKTLGLTDNIYLGQNIFNVLSQFVEQVNHE